VQCGRNAIRWAEHNGQKKRDVNHWLAAFGRVELFLETGCAVERGRPGCAGSAPAACGAEHEGVNRNHRKCIWLTVFAIRWRVVDGGSAANLKGARNGAHHLWKRGKPPSLIMNVHALSFTLLATLQFPALVLLNRTLPTLLFNELAEPVGRPTSTDPPRYPCQRVDVGQALPSRLLKAVLERPAAPVDLHWAE